MSLADFKDVDDYPIEYVNDDTQPVVLDTETVGYTRETNFPFYYSWYNEVLGSGAGPTFTEKGFAFLKALCKSKRPIICHNIKFDLRRFRDDLDLKVTGPFHDTILMHCLLDEFSLHGLKYLAKTILGSNRGDQLEEYWLAKGYKNTEKGRACRDNTTVPPELMYAYAKDDAKETWSLFKIFYNALTAHGLLQPYMICLQAELQYYRLESYGIACNKKILDETIPELEILANKMAQEAYKLLEQEFNLNSPAQLSKVLVKAGIQLTQKAPKSGNFKTGKEILSQFIGDPKIQAVQAWRYITNANKKLKEYSKYLRNGRLYTSYNQVLVTGRASSRQPNLMGIPKQQGRISEVDVGNKKLAKQCAGAFKKVRSSIICNYTTILGTTCKIPSSILLTRDYDQGEYRAFTYYSGSKRLIDKLKAGEDFHRMVSMLVFGEHTARLRHIVKIVNFGLIYGMGESLLIETIRQGDPTIDGRDVLRRYEQYLPEMRSTQQDMISKAARKGYISDVFGRRYHYLENAPYKIVSYICQGTIANIKKIAMVRTGRLLKGTRSSVGGGLDIHDELVFNMYPEDAWLALKFKKVMEDFPQFGGIPITTDCKAGFNLLDMYPSKNGDECEAFIRTHNMDYLKVGA